MVKEIKSFFYNKGVKLFLINRYKDKRGYLLKVFDKNNLKEKIEDVYISRSRKNVFRGLHYTKLKNVINFYSCIQGQFIHYFFDTRVKSKTYGNFEFFKNNERNIIIKLSPGIAHGVLTLKNESLLLCLSTGKYNGKNEKIISYKRAGIKLPKNIILSDKDRIN